MTNSMFIKLTAQGLELDTDIKINIINLAN